MAIHSIRCVSRCNQESLSTPNSTRRPRWRAIVLMALAVVCSNSSPTFAAEAATIVNASSFSVELFLKWSHLPFESPKYVLAPGQSLPVSGPDDAQLHVRFNSAAPGLPALEKRYRVVTAPTFDPRQAGFVSSFRNVTPLFVDLFGF